MGVQEQARILEIVEREGLVLAGIARAEPVAGVREAAMAALVAGRLAGMAWMDDAWIRRAADPQAFLPGARTIIVAALPCHSPEPAEEPGPARGRIARYARGRDYHRVFESRLRRIARAIREEFGETARATVDYGPLLERPYAAAAGAGWLGKSTMLLVPGWGPWVLLGVVTTSLALEAGSPTKKTCGSCTRCIVACPTGAIAPDGHVLDARLCISYHTIENRGVVPRDLRAKFKDWVFGCDDCLDSCPVGAKRWDSYPEFAPADLDGARPVLRELLSLDEEAFSDGSGDGQSCGPSATVVRNACIALGNVGTGDDSRHWPMRWRMGPRWCGGTRSGRWGAWASGCGAGVEGLLEGRLAIEQDPWVREEIGLALAETDDGG